MRWSLLFLLFGCAKPQVEDIVFPAVTIDADGSVRGVVDAPSLTSTNRQGIERFIGRTILSGDGRSYVIEAVKEIDPPGMFSDFAGTKHFQVALTLKRGPRIGQSAAVTKIAETIRATPGYLDLTVQGRDAVADEIARKTTVGEVGMLLATTYQWSKVTSEASERENRRVEELARRGE